MTNTFSVEYKRQHLWFSSQICSISNQFLRISGQHHVTPEFTTHHC